MERSTIIMGNGLGMALDPKYFSLDRALEDVWDKPDFLTDVQKTLITKCLAKQGAVERPKSEDDLDILHRVVVACEYLVGVGEGEIHWLSEYGHEFPEAIRRYLTAVAWYFHYHESSLKDGFLSPLSNYITESKSHLATLNYDNLLYQELIERQVLQGYDGSLVDGFHSDGFSEKNLQRLYGKDFGYYMHLHGSPLFIEKDGCIIKQHQGKSKEIPTSHLVLTHVEHKPSVIDSSYLLRTYWRYLEKAIQECQRIIIFRYSGRDSHLNRFIRARAEGKSLSIVERAGSGKFKDREEYWRQKMLSDVVLLHLQNVIDFTDWNTCSYKAEALSVGT